MSLYTVYWFSWRYEFITTGLTASGVYTREKAKKVEVLDLQGLPCGGLYWTRTSDPIDVNDVLYQLSQQTTLPFVVPSGSDYRLSHATSLFDVSTT